MQKGRMRGARKRFAPPAGRAYVQQRKTVIAAAETAYPEGGKQPAPGRGGIDAGKILGYNILFKA